MNEEFKTAIAELYPYFKQTDKFEIKDSTLKLQQEFKEIFPTLAKLVSKARQYEFDLVSTKRNIPFRLLLWTTKDNLLCGWLCNLENNASHELDIIKEHTILLENIGGIQENFCQSSNDDYLLTSNQDFLFVKSQCYKAGDNMNYYIELCNEDNLTPIDTSSLMCFVREANGNETFYDTKTKKVLLFAHDHAFDNVKEIENQPDYTFYTINEATTFVDYVELLAKQWTAIIK